MQLSILQISIIAVTIAIALGGGIYAARSVHSAEGFSLGGRSAGVPMVAGTIAGTCIGGGATVGTAQLAGTVGLSAWWFTIGTGLALVIMGLFYAKPLRGTALETIAQYLVLNYGKGAGHFTTVVSSLGIFFSAVASCLPGIAILAALTGMPSWAAALALTVLVACYGFFGGLKSAGVGGMIKAAILWGSLFIAGILAWRAISGDAALSAALPAFPWFSLIGGGVQNALVGSIAGLSLGIGTMLTRGIFTKLFHVEGAASELRLSRIVVLGVILAACAFSLANEGSQVLFWNYLSMALRGGGIFLPLTVAVFRPHAVSARVALMSMILSTLTAVVAAAMHTSVSPLFIGLGVSVITLLPGLFGGHHDDDDEQPVMAED